MPTNLTFIGGEHVTVTASTSEVHRILTQAKRDETPFIIFATAGEDVAVSAAAVAYFKPHQTGRATFG